MLMNFAISLLFFWWNFLKFYQLIVGRASGEFWWSFGRGAENGQNATFAGTSETFGLQ